MLGFNDISEATVSRYLRKFQSNNPDKKKQQSWMTFLKNHRDVVSAMDFFIVPKNARTQKTKASVGSMRNESE